MRRIFIELLEAGAKGIFLPGGGTVDHIIFGYNFVPIGRDVIEMIDTSKQLSKFAK